MDKFLQQLAEIDGKIDAILAGDLTDDKVAEHDALVANREQVAKKLEMARANQARVDERQRLEDEAKKAARSVPGSNRQTDAVYPVVTVPATPINHAAEQSWGFANFGHFAREVHSATISQRPSSAFDGARRFAAATGMGEAIGNDGGFLVPVEFSNKIFERLYAEESLLAMTEIYNIGGNSIKFPRNAETSRAAGSRWGGVQAYWYGEGTAGTATKPGFGQLTLNLHKLIALGVASDELLEDSGIALEQYLFRCFSDEINFNVNDSLINGTGAGQPLGVLNADCTVSVSKETGQSAATLNATNILKMWSRMFAGSRAKAVWLINQDVEPQLYSMQIGTGVANQVVYMPPGGLSGAPYATLMGRPVMAVPYCATLGTVGDIILVDMSQWATAVKGGGPRKAVSMHLYFDRDEQAFRVTYRVDSQPWWPSALTPFKGSNTQSCAVTLATRA